MMLIPPSLADSVHFRLLYDARATYPFLDLFIIVFLAMAIGGFWKVRTEGGFAQLAESNGRDVFMGMASMAFGAYGTFFIVMTVILPDLRLRRALTEGRAELREGSVGHYHPEGLDESGNESWWLVTPGDSFPYHYGTHLQKPGYSQVGKLAEGAWVRVWDVQGDIGRLEVAP